MRVDDQFMEDVGLGAMPADEKRAFMQHAEEELEVRVGRGIGTNLSAEQLNQFDQITDLEKITEWLGQNVPNFREMVSQIYQDFKQEIAAERQNILGA